MNKKEYLSNYYLENRTELLEKAKKYRIKNKEKVKKQKQEYYKKNIEKIKQYKKDNIEKIRAYKRRRRQELKLRIMQYYGNCQCACCKENNIKFLSIDHINGDGIKHRAMMRAGGGKFYEWIVRNNFPEGLQVLCFNCNLGRSVNGGVCPHKESSE